MEKNPFFLGVLSRLPTLCLERMPIESKGRAISTIISEKACVLDVSGHEPLREALSAELRQAVFVSGNAVVVLNLRWARVQSSKSTALCIDAPCHPPHSHSLAHSLTYSLRGMSLTLHSCFRCSSTMELQSPLAFAHGRSRCLWGRLSST
eukprot:6175495-Pleurochrysis_carterae.AAC.1